MFLILRPLRARNRCVVPAPTNLILNARPATAVYILEVEGGNDKGPDGHRPDTEPLIAAFERRGWNATALFYTDGEADSILRTVAAKGDAYIARINPGEPFSCRSGFTVLYSKV